MVRGKVLKEVTQEVDEVQQVRLPQCVGREAASGREVCVSDEGRGEGQGEQGAEGAPGQGDRARRLGDALSLAPCDEQDGQEQELTEQAERRQVRRQGHARGCAVG